MCGIMQVWVGRDRSGHPVRLFVTSFVPSVAMPGAPNVASSWTRGCLAYFSASMGLQAALLCFSAKRPAVAIDLSTTEGSSNESRRHGGSFQGCAETQPRPFDQNLKVGIECCCGVFQKKPVASPATRGPSRHHFGSQCNRKAMGIWALKSMEKEDPSTEKHVENGHGSTNMADIECIECMLARSRIWFSTNGAGVASTRAEVPGLCGTGGCQRRPLRSLDSPTRFAASLHSLCLPSLVLSERLKGGSCFAFCTAEWPVCFSYFSASPLLVRTNAGASPVEMKRFDHKGPTKMVEDPLIKAQKKARSTMQQRHALRGAACFLKACVVLSLQLSCERSHDIQ